MERAELLGGIGLRGIRAGTLVRICGGVGVDGGGAEEAAEAGAGDFRGRVVVDVGLVVGEEGEFLFGEGVGFQGDFEFVGWFDIRLQMSELAFVEGTGEVEGMMSAFLVSGEMSVGTMVQIVVEQRTLCSLGIS